MTRSPDGTGRVPRTRRAVVAAGAAAMAMTAAVANVAGGVVYGRRRRVSRQVEQNYRRELLDAEIAALSRLREAGHIRDELTAAASHEFRTPLTTIRAGAITLLGRHDTLRPEDRERLLTGILDQADRLGKLLEDMLDAASAAATDRGTVADVTGAIHRLSPRRPPRRSVVEAAPGLRAHIEPLWLDQIVNALADHLRTAARRDTPVRLCAREEGREVAIRATYHPADPSCEPACLFEPVVGNDRRSGSLALFVARRLAEVHGGHVGGSRGEDGQITLAVLLRAARQDNSAGGEVATPGDR